MKGALIYLFSLFLVLPLVAQTNDPALQVLNSVPTDKQNAMEFLFSSADRGDKVLLQRSVNELLDYKISSMYDNAVPLAAQVLAGIKKAKKLDIKTRILLLKKNVEIAPVLPQTRMALAAAYLSGGSGNTAAAVSSFVDGLGRLFEYLPGLFVFLGNMAFYLGQGIALAVILFAISLLFRKAPLLGHDIVDMLPGLRMNVMDVWDPHQHHMRMEKHSENLGKWLVLVMAFIPLAIGLGLLPSALVWIIILGLYINGRELTAAIVVVALASMIPFMALQVGASSSLQQGLGEKIYNCGTDMCSDADASTIVQATGESNKDALTKYLALALHELHKTPFLPQALDEAAKFAVKIPDSSAKFIVLGNIETIKAFRNCRLATDKRGIPDHRFLETASSYYKKAASMAPDDPAPLYGMSLIETYRYERKALEDTYKKLVRLTPESNLSRLARMREDLTEKDFCQNNIRVNGVLHNPKYPWDQAYLGNITYLGAPMIFPFSTILVGNLPRLLLLLMGPIALILLILASIVSKSFSLAQTCNKCSTVSCSKCNLTATGFDYCPTCLLAQVRGGMIGQEEAFLLRRKSEKKKQRRLLFNLISALLVPGTGQVAEGRTITGMILLFSVSTLIFWVAYPWPPFADLRAFVGFDSIEPSLLPPVLLIIVYGISWVDAWRRQTR